MIAIALSSVLALLAADAGPAAGEAPLGWTPSPLFVLSENARDAPDFHREFYKHGESAAHWSERVVVSIEPIGDGDTPASLLDRRLERARTECPGGREARAELNETATTQGLTLFSCPRHTQTGRGELALWRVLVDAHRAYWIVAQGDFASFERGKSPLDNAQLDRWVEFQKSFAICADWTSTLNCAPRPERYLNAAPAELTPQEASAVAASERRGRELYHLDQLAWHATDFGVQKKLIETGKNGIFIAVPGANFPAGAVYFIQDQGRGDWVRIDIDGDGQPSLGAKDKALPLDVRERVRAQEVASKAEIKACGTGPLNTAVMHDDDGVGWLVYFLTQMRQDNQLPIGGHTRVRLDASAEHVLATDYATRGCFALDLKSAEQRAFERSAEVTPLFTQLTADVPWETVVFESLTGAHDLVVITRHAIWRVGKGHIVKLTVAPPAPAGAAP